MQRFGWVALALILLTLIASPTAQAEKRIALVIGNGAYVKGPKLPNPTNDSAAMAGLLRKAGFDVVEEKADLSADAMRRVLRDFSEHVRDADIAVVFYAGHGMEMNGVNYLIPVDATLARDVDVEDEAVSLDRVIRTLEPVRRLQLVILDACRDNPFLRSMRRTVISRSVRSGHGEIDEKTLPPNTLIAYAQKAGATAEDGTSSNSPYTTALLKHLPTPGLDVELALRRVRDEVLQATRNRQEPFEYGSLGGAELPLVPAVANPWAPIAPQPVNTAEREWQQYAKDTKDVRLLEAFKKKHKEDPVYVRLAEARIEDLKNQTAAARPTEPAKQGLLPGVLKETVGIVLPPAAGNCDGIEITVGQNERRCFKPGAGRTEWFKDCPTCPEMVVVPSGQFMMGPSAGERGPGPQHEVTITRSFAVGRFPITRGEFATFVKDTKHKADSHCRVWTGSTWEQQSDKSWRSPGFAQDDRHPVVCVNWDDAKAFAAWISQKTGKRYRLLSEAEWEYAARAGSTTRYSFGDDVSALCRHGNVNDQTARRTITGADLLGPAHCDDGYAYTAPVGQFAANVFGLHDMHGNVSNWIEDCWSPNYAFAPADGSALTAGDCGKRVVRGGSWLSPPVAVSSANRSWWDVTSRSVLDGFRLARTLSP